MTFPYLKMGNNIVLKVNIDQYYTVPKKHLDMIYKIGNFEYRFEDGVCFKQSLNVISGRVYKLQDNDPEVTFVRTLKNIDATVMGVQDIETSVSVDTTIVHLTKLRYKPENYDFRVVIH